LYVDGIQMPLANTTTGAGLNAASGVGPSVPVCALICTSIPSAWASVAGGPTPVGVVDIAGVQITVPNVLTSKTCVSTPGATCP
jgi:hypothetical protein